MSQIIAQKQKKEMDMIHGNLAKNMTLFALPLAASSILQQLFNATDIAIVGKFVGSSALAAVGANTSLISLFVNLFVGLSVGVNVTIATLIGQNKRAKISDVVHTAICFALLLGLFISCFGQFIARWVLIKTNAPVSVLDDATLYLRIYFCGIPCISLYNFCSAILRSIGDTKRPLMALMTAGCINVCLNLIFVIFFHMGVSGVALATVLANVVSTGMVLSFLMRAQNELKLSLKNLCIHSEPLLKILRIGAPAAIQSMVFSLSNVFVQSGINSFGEDAAAGSSAGLNYEYITYFVANSFNQATVTFTGQNYGAGEHENCKKVMRIGMLLGMLYTACFSAVFAIFAVPLSYVFTQNANVVAYSVIRMRHVMALEAMVCTYEITGASLRGRGISMTPAILTIIGSVVFRIIWLFTVFARWHSFEVLMNVYPVSWLLTACMTFTAYFILKSRDFRI